ncbi:MAG TPA: LuxR family transcriptional regulator [Rhodocyclaceae bacterium]|nr:LuxR family transcriptional regulator [Rhodocyclaceae bacterium]
MQAKQTEAELFQALQQESHRIGFDYCAYGLRLPLPLSAPRTVMFNNYPDEWQARYANENYLSIDPTVRHGMTSLVPLVWTDEIFMETHGFWEDARSYGLCHGWAQSSIDPGGIKGMLTLSRAGEPLSETELRAKGCEMVWLTQVAHLCMSQLVSNRLQPEKPVELSQREISILRWTAEAKTSSEVSDILGISERTVNFHITNAMEKLGCANKTAATVRAALLGLLY